jgi:acetyl-CoA carboxylase biotin carboxyl carrier protein
LDLDLDTLRTLSLLLAEHDITEFEHETEEGRLKIVRGPRGVTTVVAPGGLPASVMAAPLPGAPAPAGATAAEPASDTVEVTSPLPGTFYRAPAPDAPSFVDIGSVVRPGQTLCIVEAMKLMNEIEAECSGTIVEVVVQNGKPVEFGQTLFRIKKA